MDWDKINLKICRKLSEITFWVPYDCMVKNEKTQKESVICKRYRTYYEC